MHETPPPLEGDVTANYSLTNEKNLTWRSWIFLCKSARSTPPPTKRRN